MSLPSLQEFEQVLKNILSPNNQLRKQAEEYFNQSKSQPDYCIGSLVRILRSSSEAEVRSLACVLLRRCLAESDENALYSKLSSNLKTFVKTELINALSDEKEDHIRNKLVYAVSSFVAPRIETGEFPEFVPLMFDWAKGTNSQRRESALHIFNQLATHLMNKGLEPYMTQLKEILQVCLVDNNNKVRLAALEATSSIVLVVEKTNRAKFQELIPVKLQVLAKALNAGDVTSANSVIESLIEIVVSHASFFKSHAPQVITAMYQIAKTKQLDDGVRHLAMEFMVSMAENAPKLVSKIPSFVDNLFPLCMDMMLDIEEDEDWANTYEDEDLDLTNYDVGLESLDRIALSLGGKLVQPVAFKLIPQFLNNQQSWKHRLAGLMSIAQTAEGCNDEYSSHLKTLVGMALQLFKDPHPRVRYAAIHCAAQLSTDFAGTIQAKFHNQIVPGLMSAMDDQVPRVQSHAATAVVNFVEDCERQYIEPYLDSLLGKLLSLLKGGMRFVQEQSLSAISAIADCAEKAFLKYYDAIIPFLKQILLKATGKQDRMLRARAIECVSLIGVAVGKQKFGGDAKEVMELLHKTQQTPLEPDDPQIHHLLQAWTRIAKCLGDDFIPYLSYVMPPLLKAAEQQPQVVVSDADEEAGHDDEGMESVTLSIKGVGDKRISIRTSALEEKALACSMLYSYVVELKDGFCPWVENVAKIMVPLLKFAYLEQIRETAAQIMPQLLRSVKIAAEKGKADAAMVKQLLDFILKTLFEAAKIEPEVKTISALAESIKECLVVAGPECINNEQIEQATGIIKTVLLESVQRKQQIEETIDEEDDEEEQERMDEEAVYEDELLSMLVELIGTMMKTSASFIPVFINQLWPVYSKMLDPKLTPDEHRLALCVICDFIEHGRGAAAQFANETVPALLAYAQDKSPEVRQAAVYGLGALAQFGGQPFVQVASEVIAKLKAVISAPDAKEEDNAAATANAVSALYKVMIHRAEAIKVNPSELLQVWLMALPVSGDSIEARIVHGNLVEMIQKNSAMMFGTNNSNVPHIIKVFANCLDTDLMTEEVQEKAVKILATMQSTFPPQFLAQAWSGLSAEEQKNVSSVMARVQGQQSPKK